MRWCANVLERDPHAPRGGAPIPSRVRFVRAPVEADRLRRFLRELGRRAHGPGRIYLTGGATAVLIGWRTSTVDVHIKLDPEPLGAFAAIARAFFGADDE